MAQSLQAKLLSSHSLGATFKSPWLDCRGSYHVSIQLTNAATGTPVGAWTIEESNDTQIESNKWSAEGDSTADTVAKVDASASTRVEIVGSGLAVSSANSTIIHIERPARYVRLVYTRTSGTGSATAYAQGVM